MKTKNIFKTLAFAMLMPTMLLTTACSSEDDVVNTENLANAKGYALPVTINVTRQGDAATRATFNETSRKLEFSAGDKLFVEGSYNEGKYSFAGTLDFVSDGTFSGTITTQTEWTGTADELLSSADDATAELLPAGYESYGFLSIVDENSYEAFVDRDYSKVVALTKAAAVEQFSNELVFEYDNGFALSPWNAIVCFTISGLTANAQVAVLFKSYYGFDATQVNVTTDESGVATFAAAMLGYEYFNDYKLTVDGNAIALPANKKVEAGKIYNISRSVAPAGPTYPVALSAVTSEYVGSVVTTDGNVYATTSDATTAGKTAAAMIAYVGGTGNNLAIALADEGSMNWATAKSACEGKTAIGGYSWKLPSQDEWKVMFSANGGNEENPRGLDYALIDAGGNRSSLDWHGGSYWSSSEDVSGISAYRVACLFQIRAVYWDTNSESNNNSVRAVLVF